MKTKILLILSLSSTLAFAQPSESQIKADVKKQFPSATSISVSGTGSSSKEVESGVLKTIYRRNVNVTVPTGNAKYPTTKWEYRGAVRYDVNGGSYSFVKYNPGDEILHGMPDPNKQEVLAFINANKSELFVNKNTYLGEPEDFVFAEPVSFKWLSFDRVQFDAITKFEEITSNFTTEVFSEKKRINIYGKDGSNWNKVIGEKINEIDAKKSIEKKKITAEELELKNTWGEKLDLEIAMNIWSNLDPMNIPVFQDVYQASNFVNEILLTGDERKIQSLLFNMFPQEAFKAPEYKAFSRWGSDFYHKMMNATTSGNYLFKDQFCKVLDVKQAGQDYVDFYNKDQSSYCRFTFGVDQKGQWKLIETIMNVLQDSKGAEFKAMECSKKSITAVERGTQIGVGKLKVKDYVLAYYESDRMWYPCFYLGYENSYYDVQYFIDNSKGKVRKAIPMDIQVGDKAFVKTQSGALVEVTVKSINGLDVVIDFNGQDTAYKVSGLLFK